MELLLWIADLLAIGRLLLAVANLPEGRAPLLLAELLLRVIIVLLLRITDLTKLCIGRMLLLPCQLLCGQSQNRVQAILLELASASLCG